MKTIKCKKCEEEFSSEMLNCPNCGMYVNQPVNPICVAGFAVSLISVFFLNPYGIVSVVGIILSIIGLRKIKATRNLGKGLAIAGIIVGALNLIYMIAIVTFLEEWIKNLNPKK